jgi:hypothetical protein
VLEVPSPPQPPPKPPRHQPNQTIVCDSQSCLQE